MNDGRNSPNQKRGRALVDLVARRLPQDFDIPREAWPAIGVALLSRMASTLAAVLDLQLTGRAIDARTLARSLYEHAVHFAWLSASPTADRIEEWRKNDLVSRLRADRDTAQRGAPLLTDESRALFRAQVKAMKGSKLVLAKLAEIADERWGDKIPAMGPSDTINSFRGWYAMLYRGYSASAHPSVVGLGAVWTEINPTTRRIHLERPTDRDDSVFGISTIVFGAVLLIAAESLGWPKPDEVDAIFAQYASPGVAERRDR